MYFHSSSNPAFCSTILHPVSSPNSFLLRPVTYVSQVISDTIVSSLAIGRIGNSITLQLSMS